MPNAMIRGAKNEDGYKFDSLKEKLDSGLISPNGVVREDLITEVERFAAALRKAGVTQSSIRKIYDSFKTLQLRIQQEFMALISSGECGNNFEQAAQQAFLKIRPLMLLLKNKSKYVIERKKKDTKKDEGAVKAYDDFQAFISTCAAKTHSSKEFNAFMDLFECIIANLKE